MARIKLGEIIKAYRAEQGLSMQEFADHCGLSKGYISMLERGRHPQSRRALIPSLETCRKLAAAMGLRAEALLAVLDGEPEGREIDRIYAALNEAGRAELCRLGRGLMTREEYTETGP